MNGSIYRVIEEVFSTMALIAQNYASSKQILLLERKHSTVKMKRNDKNQGRTQGGGSWG